MKRTSLLMAMLLGVSVLFTACGSGSTTGTESTEPAQTEAGSENENAGGEASPAVINLSRGDYKASDYVTVKDYLGLKIDAKEVEPSDEDVKKQIDQFLSSFATDEEVTGRPVKDGDTVNIDYAGFHNDVQFEGGTAEGYDLGIGSGTFIPGFEEGLIGANIGDTVDLNVTFPDPYPNNTDLAGQPVLFKVTINSIKETVTPDLTDELVAEKTDYKTVEEYSESIKEDLRNENIAGQFAAKLYACAEFTGEYPESLTEYYYNQYFNNMILYYGEENIRGYMESSEMDEKAFVDSFLGAEVIENEMRIDLMLEAIAEQEGIKAEGSEYEEFLAKQSENLGMSVEEITAQYGEDELAFTYISNTAYEKLYNSKVVE